MTPADRPAPIPRAAESAARLVRPAERSPRVLDTEVLRHVAEGLARVVRAGPSVGPRRITRVRLLATEGYDAWLMAWGPGSALDDHDHDGSVGIVHVVDGALVESVIDHAGLSVPRRLGAGETTSFAATHRHALAAPGPGRTLSVHVHSPPLGPTPAATSDTDASPN